MSNHFQQSAQALIDAGHWLYERNMVPATSGNFSARLDGKQIAITVSGRHKGRLTLDDIMLIDFDGKALDNNRPSAETALHTQIYRRFAHAQCVLHPHSVNATLLSQLHVDRLVLQDYELLKAFDGIDSHQSTVEVPIFDNDQDISRLASRIEQWFDTVSQQPHGYLIRGHGFYTWGRSVDDAMRHVEAFEFLFECELRKHALERI